MKKRKATLCLALAAVFGISSVAGCSKTPNNSGQDEKAAESQAGSAVGGADGSGDGSGSSGESTAIKEAGPDPNASEERIAAGGSAAFAALTSESFSSSACSSRLS